MESLEQLIAEHQDSLFAFLYRLCGDPRTAEEVMQETFVRALQAAKRYRPEARISTWLFAIAANMMRDRWRRTARCGDPLPLDEVPLTAVESTEELVLESISHDLVRSALLCLPLEQRTALVLRYYHDLSYAEIAGVCACPIGTVRSRIHNGLARLKAALSEEVALR